jgi:hypothetical protein
VSGSKNSMFNLLAIFDNRQQYHNQKHQ